MMGVCLNDCGFLLNNTAMSLKLNIATHPEIISK